MARGVNKVILVGNLGNDPETKYTQGGQAVTNISIATSEKWKDKEGNTQERTEWHRIVFWGKLAEIAGEYLKKGSQVYVEGKLQTDKWTDQGGVERYTTKVIANEMQMLGGKSEGGNDRQGGERADRSRGGGTGCGGRTAGPSRGSAPPPTDDFSDDDIPF